MTSSDDPASDRGAREPRLLDVEYVARLLGVSPYSVMRRVRSGDFPHVRAGRNSVRFTPAQVEQIIASLTVEVNPSPPRVRGLSERNARARARRRRTGRASGGH